MPVQKERDAATITSQSTLIASQTDVILSLTKSLEALPASLNQSIAANLHSNVLPSLGNRTGQIVNLRTGAVQQPATSSHAAAQAQSPIGLERPPLVPTQGQHSPEPSRAGAPCVIPTPPIAKGIRSLEGVWQQYTSGTAQEPSVMQLYATHGHDWQNKQLGYDKGEFGKKRKLICAVEGVRHLQSSSSQAAVSFVQRKLKAHGNSVVRFAESLPGLHADIHPNGKQLIVAGGVLRGLSTDDQEVYNNYLKELQHKLHMTSSPIT